jgi:phosphoserine phosphatase RsbX
MTGARVDEPRVVDWGAAGFALEVESGDVHAVAPFPGGVLVGLIDGLGHGIEAAAAAQAAARLLAAHAGEPVVALVERCHEALHGTRGAVMSVASFQARRGAMTWTGVGNVEAVLLRADRAASPPREAIALRGGIVGYQLPHLRDWVLPVSPGDLLIMATDGLHDGFSDGVVMHESPQRIADSILARHARGSDDAHVLVARYLGGTP